jgi:hypothetical protein
MFVGGIRPTHLQCIQVNTCFFGEITRYSVSSGFQGGQKGKPEKEISGTCKEAARKK